MYLQYKLSQTPPPFFRLVYQPYGPINHEAKRRFESGDPDKQLAGFGKWA